MTAASQEATGTDLRIELFRRSYVPDVFEGQLERIVERLERLEREGTIAGFSIDTWDKNVRISMRDRDAVETAAATEYAKFDAWASEHDMSLRPFFDRRTVGKSETIVLPILCLAVYEDDDLRGVFPCADEESVCSVPEYLTALEAGDPWRFR